MIVIGGRSSLAAAVVGAFIALTPSSAMASDEATAEALFVQAREAMGKGDYAKACPMLEESYRLVQGIGTKFNLGECYEHLGMTASAWASFRDAAAASKLAGQKPREAAAKERAARLEDKLCRATISVAPQENLTVTRDGTAVGQGQWGVALPIDPGSHVVEATAPGMTPWSTSFTVSGCPSAMTVPVPQLVPAPATSEGPPLPPAPSGAPHDDGKKTLVRSPTRSILTVTSLGLGVVGLGLGSYFGIRAWSLRDQSNENGHCSGRQCDDIGHGLRDDSRAAGTGATIAFIAGGALLALGTILWLTDTPSSKAPAH